MNQGKLKVINEEIARVNIDILGISELKWPEWVKLIQKKIISTTVGKNPLEEMEYFKAVYCHPAYLTCIQSAS